MQTKRILLVIATLLFATLVQGQKQIEQIDDPQVICEQNSSCTSEMKFITREYQIGNTRFAEKNISAFSGGCFHLNSYYDPKTEHYAVFGFIKKEQQIFANGLFTFFGTDDPYQHMSEAQIISRLNQSSPGFQKTIENKDELKLVFENPFEKIQYWFRNTADDKNLILIGHQSNDQNSNAVFCKLTKR